MAEKKILNKRNLKSLILAVTYAAYFLTKFPVFYLLSQGFKKCFATCYFNDFDKVY